MLRALFAFSPETPRHSAESLARHIGLPLSSTYRYLAVLREARLIVEDKRGSFILGPRMIELAQAAHAGSDLADIARPTVKQLTKKLGRTIILVRRSGDVAVCILRALSPIGARLSFDVGAATPLHRGAAPKVILAHCPPQDRKALLDDLAASSPDFQLQRPQFESELEAIRMRGWAESDGEITRAINSMAVAIFDNRQNPVAAIACVWSKNDPVPATVDNALAQLRAAADEIGRTYSLF